jgi:hypothetical protein
VILHSWVYHMCEIFDPGTHMRCIRFSTENRVWQNETLENSTSNACINTSAVMVAKAVGNRAKNLSPWNVRFQSSRINSWITFGLESSSSWEGNIHEETMMHFIYFADLLIIRENNSRIRLLFANLLSVSGWLETGTVQRIRNPRSSGIWWSLSSGTTVRGGFYE